MHIFGEARGVVEALHAHDCKPALSWCAANKAKLKKIRSSLEFQLRVQVRVELPRAGTESHVWTPGCPAASFWMMLGSTDVRS